MPEPKEDCSFYARTSSCDLKSQHFFVIGMPNQLLFSFLFPFLGDHHSDSMFSPIEIIKFSLFPRPGEFIHSFCKILLLEDLME